MQGEEMSDKPRETALKEFLKNPYWREAYEGAPSELSRRYLELVFFYSENFSSVREKKDQMSELVSERERLEGAMDLQDWKHMAKYAGNNPFGGMCRQKVMELSGKR